MWVGYRPITGYEHLRNSTVKSLLSITRRHIQNTQLAATPLTCYCSELYRRKCSTCLTAESLRVLKLQEDKLELEYKYRVKLFKDAAR